MTEVRDLWQAVEDGARGEGAFAVGVADLAGEAARGLLSAQGGDLVAGFPRAVSYAFRLQDALVGALPDGHRDTVVARLYDRHVYSSANATLDAVGRRVADLLQEAGFRAVSIPASMYVDPEDLLGPLPHKLPAHLAGLGWIGRSCLLVTRKHGPRVRLGTVLTDAPFPPGEPGRNFCGTCEECVTACPAGAFSGRLFSPDEPLELRMDVRACRDYRKGVAESTGVMTCGVCVAVCPHGRDKSAE
ncbi:MAG: hypothetical protein Kow00129_05180 [Thermoleophilia bacterium]